MNPYIIKYIDNQISVFEYENNSLTPIKHRGESAQKFVAPDFWSWFKNKIEYEEEPLSFIVLCNAVLKIDDSIKLAKKHFLSQSQIEEIFYEEDLSNLNILSFPSQYKSQDIFNSIKNKKNLVQTEKDKQQKIQELTSKKNSLEASLKNELKIKNEILLKKKLLLEKIYGEKNNYIKNCQDQLDSFESNTLPKKAQEMLYQTIKFALVYAYSSDKSNALFQAKNNKHYIMLDNQEENKDTMPSFGFFAALNTQNKKPTKRKINITLDNSISLNIKENASSTKIIKETRDFFEELFYDFKEEYTALQGNLKNEGDLLINKINSLTKHKYDFNFEQHNTGKIFIDNINFSNDILEISNTREDTLNDLEELIIKRHISSSSFDWLGNAVTHQNTLFSGNVEDSNNTITLFPKNITKLIEANTNKINKKLINTQKKVLTSVDINLPAKDKIYSEELSKQSSKIDNIKNHIELVNSQRYKLKQ